MSEEGNDYLDDFLGHSTGGGGGRSSYLDDWKKRQFDPKDKGPHVDIWLSTKFRPLWVWQYPVPRVVERTRDGEVSVEVWSGAFTSWEHESVLERQRQLDDDGRRRYPPATCPMGLFIEAVREAVLTGKINWLDEVLNFEGDDPRKAKLFHAAGIYGGLNKKSFTAEEQADLKKRRVFTRDAWQENLLAQCKYIFQVCDHDFPERGLQVAKVNTMLGDRTRGVIRDARHPDALGEERGNPLLHPYAIRWWHFAQERDPGKKYHAQRMDGLKLTDEVREVIYEAQPHDVSGDTARGNVAKLRASLEEAWCHPSWKPNWDEIFEPSEAASAEERDPAEADRDLEAAEQATKTVAKSSAKPAGKPAPKAEARPSTKPASAKAAKAAADDLDELSAELDEESKEMKAAEPDGEEVSCDECGKVMLLSQTTCPHCGKEYEDEPEPEAKQPDPEPPRRSRSSAQQPAAEAKADRAPPKFSPDKKPAGNRVRG